MRLSCIDAGIPKQPKAIGRAATRCSAIGACHRSGRNIRKRENVIRKIVEPKGIHLKKLGKDRYRLVDEGLDAVMYLFDGVPLRIVEWHFEEARLATFDGH